MFLRLVSLACALLLIAAMSAHSKPAAGVRAKTQVAANLHAKTDKSQRADKT